MKLVALLLPFVFMGCKVPSLTAHDAARAGVVAMSTSVKMTYDLCSDILEYYAPSYPNLPQAQKDRLLSLAVKCDDNIAVAKDAVMISASAVDAWNEANAGKTACALMESTIALSGVITVLANNSVAVPAELNQAIRVGQAVGGLYCKESSK